MTKYQSWYDALIERARSRRLNVYKETHHIVPRSLGGSNEPSNLVDLTYREHFLAHWLLAKICTGTARYKMLHALHCMALPLGERIVGSWRVDVAKRALRNEWLRRAKIRRDIKRGRAQAKIDWLSGDNLVIAEWMKANGHRLSSVQPRSQMGHFAAGKKRKRRRRPRHGRKLRTLSAGNLSIPAHQTSAGG